MRHRRSPSSQVPCPPAALHPQPTPAREAPGNQSWKSNFLAIVEDARTPIPSPLAALTGFEPTLNYLRAKGAQNAPQGREPDPGPYETSTSYVPVSGRERGQNSANWCAKEHVVGSCESCLNPLTLSALSLVGPPGIEPRSAVPETAVLSIELQALFRCPSFRTPGAELGAACAAA